MAVFTSRNEAVRAAEELVGWTHVKVHGDNVNGIPVIYLVMVEPTTGRLYVLDGPDRDPEPLTA